MRKYMHRIFCLFRNSNKGHIGVFHLYKELRSKVKFLVKKIIYPYYLKYLPMDHPWPARDSKAFDKEKKVCSILKWLKGNYLWQYE